MTAAPPNLHALPGLGDRAPVFRHRAEAGDALAELVRASGGSRSLILGVAAGGVPVAAAVARSLSLPFEVFVVSKITLPWNTEAGYGAVAEGDLLELNRDLLARLPLTEKEIEAGIARTREKVARRVRKLRGGDALPDLTGAEVLLVDDGLASGLTLRVGVAAIRKLGAARVEVGVPTAHLDAACRLAPAVEALYAANLRGGGRFAVADAYEVWSDVPDEELLDLLRVSGLPLAPRDG